MKKLIWTVLALMAIAFGALFGVYMHWKNIGKISEDTGFFSFLAGGGRMPQVADATKEGSKETDPAARLRKGSDAPRLSGRRRKSRAKKDSDEEFEVTSAGMIRPQFDRGRYERLLTAGKTAYMGANYPAAEKKYTEAAELAGESREKGRQVKAEQMAKRSRVFGALVSKIPVEPIADGKDIAEIYLTFGGDEPFVARIVEETRNRVKIIKESGISATFQKSEIDDIKRLTPGQYRMRLIAKLDKQLREAEKTGKPSYIDLYQCTYFATQFKLTERITVLLEKTFAVDMATELIEIFCPRDPVGLKVALLESYGRDTEAKAVRDAAGSAVVMAEPYDYEQPAREPEERTSTREAEEYTSPGRPAEKEQPRDAWRPAPGDADDSGEPVPERPSKPPERVVLENNPDYQRAQRAYNEGVKYYRRSLPGMPNHNENLRKAEPYMREALDILSRFAEQYPDNAVLDEQIQKINMIIYDIYKRSPLK